MANTAADRVALGLAPFAPRTGQTAARVARTRERARSGPEFVVADEPAEDVAGN